MSELLEKTNYNEEQYFECKFGNHYDNHQPVASPNYSVPAVINHMKNKKVMFPKRKENYLNLKQFGYLFVV